MSARVPRLPPNVGQGASLRRRPAGALLCVLLALPAASLAGMASTSAAPGAAGVVASAGAPAAGQSTGPAFDRVEHAWRTGSAKRIVRAMASNRLTRFTLLAYPLSGKTCRMKPKQARASLKAYFRRIKGIGLKDVTPRTSPASVRLYEFTYTPERENVRTTRLHIQLTQDRKGPWVLTSVTESAKPRD